MRKKLYDVVTEYIEIKHTKIYAYLELIIVRPLILYLSLGYLSQIFRWRLQFFSARSCNPSNYSDNESL